MNEFLTRKQSGQYLKDTYGICSHHQLAKLVQAGTGPCYVICGRSALYKREDLDSWMRSRMSDPDAFKRGRPNNLGKRTSKGVRVDISFEPANSVTQQHEQDEKLKQAFEVLRTLGI